MICQNFRRSKETIYRHFRQVLFAIGELRDEMIRPPSTDVHPKILGNHRWDPYFKVIVISPLLLEHDNWYHETN